MFAALNEQDLLCRVFGDCRAGDPIDREVGDLVGAVGPLQLEQKLFTYLRYNAELTREELDGSAARHRAPDVQQLDSIEGIPDLRESGEERRRDQGAGAAFRGLHAGLGHQRMHFSFLVIPAKAGIEGRRFRPSLDPSFAGVTRRTNQRRRKPMTSTRRAFVIMPFGQKEAAGRDRDRLRCRLQRSGGAGDYCGRLDPHRADADRRGGSIHLDMFQDLLFAEFVVADLALDNPNVWYEIGVRHALRAGGAVLTYAFATGCRLTSRVSGCSDIP